MIWETKKFQFYLYPTHGNALYNNSANALCSAYISSNYKLSCLCSLPQGLAYAQVTVYNPRSYLNCSFHDVDWY